MAGTKDLRALRAGEEAYVARIGDEGDIARRLEDIGLTPGTRVGCLFAAPSGEPRLRARGRDGAAPRGRRARGA